jgi:hypothetical protein
MQPVQLQQAQTSELHRRVGSAVHEKVEQVMAAVNAARDGHLIDDSERRVNDLLNDLKCCIYQEALQVRLDATEASFSPCGRSDGPSALEQGSRLRVASDAGRPGADASSPLRASEARQRQPAG